jgi:hypothetical protein
MAGVHDDLVIFHSGPVEFPVATLRPRDPATRTRVLWVELGGWALARWQWLRPRTVPVLVAALSLVAVLASADALRHVKTAPPHYTSSR